MRLILLLLLVVGVPHVGQAQKSKKGSKTDARQLEQGQTSTDGKRIGKWNFYDLYDKLELTFDYDSSRISFLPPDTARYAMLNGEQWTLTAMNRPPRILGSKDHRLMMVGSQVRYPIGALQQQLQGTVVLAYTVGADGRSRDYSVISGVGGGCTEEVWKVVQQLPDTWIPAIYQGRPVDTRFYLKVEFKITNSPPNLATARKQAALAADSQPDSAATPPAHSPPYVEEVVVNAYGVMRTETPIRQPRQN